MTEEKTCEIISVGTELLLGEIEDTNATWLSRKLATLGLNVYERQTVGDNRKRIYEALKRANMRADLVIVTGGLGPTEDDLTRHAACDLFGCKLEIDEMTMSKIERWYQEKGLHMTENNRKQALSFTGAQVFQNEVGMAPGLRYDYEDTLFFFLPGVPTEMKWLMEHQVIPFLYESQMIKYQLFSRELVFKGIGESTLETELMDLIRNQTNPTIAPLAGAGFVKIRLTAKSKSEKEAQELLDPLADEILSRVPNYYVGHQPIRPEREIVDRLRTQNKTLAACESLTGGLFASEIVSVSGASQAFKGAVVSYTNEVKNTVVGIDSELLETEGAVSSNTAIEMAEKTLRLMNTDYAISFTGIADREEVDNQPPGTVFIAVASRDQKTICEKLSLNGSRNDIRTSSVQQGMGIFLKYIEA